jgi:hypothetical protein
VVRKVRIVRVEQKQRIRPNSEFSATGVCAIARGGTATATAMLGTSGIKASLESISVLTPIEDAGRIIKSNQE